MLNLSKIARQKDEVLSLSIDLVKNDRDCSCVLKFQLGHIIFLRSVLFKILLKYCLIYTCLISLPGLIVTLYIVLS